MCVWWWWGVYGGLQEARASMGWGCGGSRGQQRGCNTGEVPGASVCPALLHFSSSSHQKPERDAWGSTLEAMEAALQLEKTVNKALLDLHRLASEKADPHVSGVPPPPCVTPLETSPPPNPGVMCPPPHTLCQGPSHSSLQPTGAAQTLSLPC